MHLHTLDGKNERDSRIIYDLKGTHVNFCINLQK